MERWFGKVAVVTGAGSGIGAAIAKHLMKFGIIVVGLDINIDTIKLCDQHSPGSKGELHAVKCDVTKEEEIKSSFSWVEKHFGGVDIMINNAGVNPKNFLMDANSTESIQCILNTNVLGVALCTREAFHSMKNRNVAGHIILMNSVAGHSIMYRINKKVPLQMYPSSKYAITAMTEVLRQEFQMFKTNIKISSISPGVVGTSMIKETTLNRISYLKPEDIAAAVEYILGTPPHVQVHELMIKPICEKF